MKSAGKHYGHGLALRPEHSARPLPETLAIDWVEVLTERFFLARGGAHFAALERLRREMPVSLHGTMLSIGSAEPLRESYLRDLKDLADRVQPVWVSDHLAWSTFAAAEMDLMPLPFTEEVLEHVVERVGIVQDRLGRRILLENPSSYLAYKDSTMTEWNFLAAVAQRADCGILLDVNNIHVSAHNLGFDPLAYLDGVPSDRVFEIHVAGHHDAGDLLFDTHEGPVPGCVWGLYREAVRRFGGVSTIVEWDVGDASLEDIEAEVRRATAAEKEVQDEARRDPDGAVCAHLG
ncbi:MAG TPA: DUF692 domain-containing protein [Vicinamibacteria bacterium]